MELPSLPFARRLLRSALLAAIAVPGLFAAAQPASLPDRPQPYRMSTRLTNGWEVYRSDLGGVWETLRSNALALDLPRWESVTLPHCVNASDAVDPDVPYYQGPAWYRTHLAIDNPYAGGRTLLHFEGAGQRSDVWIGDRHVGRHADGYGEFTLDITDAVAAWKACKAFATAHPDHHTPPGRVPLAVRTDNTRDLEAIPSNLSDFNLYGGLYRHVNLVYVPDVSLDHVHVMPERQGDGTWRVGIKVRFRGAAAPAAASAGARPATPAAPVELRVQVLDPRGATVVDRRATVSAAGEWTELPALTLANGALWSPSSPSLYRLHITATTPGGGSEIQERFGLRWFEFIRHGPFHLNGERLLLRGTHRHEDHAGVAAAMTDAMMEEEMRLMKAMGANFIRLGHYPQSRRILELCDELGLLVWEEIPWCRGGLGGERFRQQARDSLARMIDQHHNHPSVILWGLGNENDWPGDFAEFDQAKIRAFMRELHELSHQLDPRRKTAIRRCDFCKDIVDVYSPSIWAGWYRGQFIEYREVSEREMKKVDHFLHVEWGGDSHAGRHAEDPYAPLRDLSKAGAADERGLDFMRLGGNSRASKDGDWSETYICDLVDWHLKEQETMPWLTGTAMWPFKDFSTPLRFDNPVPFMNQKGAVERDLTTKEVFYVYQSYWTTQPMLRIYGHSWPVRLGRAGEKRWVKVYSNCVEAELFLNGQSLGTRRRASADFPAAGLRWEVPFADGMNHLRAIGRATDGSTVSDEVTLRYETRRWGAPARLELREVARTGDRIRLRATLLDAKGVICLDSRAFVRFGHAGDGRLRDNLGTAKGARLVQLGTGTAEIDVILPGGTALVSVASEGLATAWVRVERSPVTLPAAAAEPNHPSGTGHAPSAVGKAAAGLTAAATAPAADPVSFILAQDQARIRRLADLALAQPAVSLRNTPPPAFAAAASVGPGDFYSMGDYWWPDPAKPDGLPYVRRDGETNPTNFESHRLAVRTVRDAVAALASGYLLDRDERTAAKAAALLRTFFIDPTTRMNPHLRFAQAIPGVSSGRGIGIIDTLHLAEVPLAAEALAGARTFPPDVSAGLKEWFSAYLEWMLTHPNGLEEARARNNHSVAYYLQVAVFARYTGRSDVLATTRQIFRERLLPGQMDRDGGFPLELARTKPYGYSLFQLDCMALLAHILSTPQENLVRETLPDGRGILRAVDFMQPYIENRDAWPYGRDVAHFDAWPARHASLLVAGMTESDPRLLQLWSRLPADPENLEVRRNLAVTQPVLWFQPRP